MGTRIILLFVFLSVQFSSQGQVLYKIKFKDKKSVSYEGLLVYFNESNAYMRIAYYMPAGQYNVVNVDYKSATGWYPDSSSYFFMTGSNPRFITDKSSNLIYHPDFFVWRKARGAKNYDPPSTTDDPKLQLSTEHPVDSFLQLKPYKVTEIYLRTFFGANEPEFLALKKLCTTQASPDVSNTGHVNLHLILIANTQIGDIGSSCSADRDKLQYEFSSVAEALGIGFKKYIVDGADFKKVNVQNTLNALQCGPQDIVVFVYTGHGFRWNDQRDEFPMLDLRTSSYMRIDQSTSMPLSEVGRILKSKGARLNIVMGDCCNSNVGINQMTSTTFLNAQADNRPDVSKLRRLFMDSRGTVISAAAHAGEVSWANPFGGFYTLSFIQAMKYKISYFNDGDYTWNSIINYTLQLAKDKSTPILCNNCTAQTGVSSVAVSY